MGSQKGLSTNGLVMPSDFPVSPYEAVHARLPKDHPENTYYREHAGAWNAVAHRFLAAAQYSDDFTASIRQTAGSASVEARHYQEKSLFGFFTNGLSAIEATFYGLFAMGGLLNSAFFPMTTPEDQQNVTPRNTFTTYGKAFPGDPILIILGAVLKDSAYQELKQIRNVLAHRTAPGRQIYLTVGDSEPMAEEWKLFNIPLDVNLTVRRRAQLARLLMNLLEGAEIFAETRF